MKKRPTNIAESVRQRLLNLSRKNGEDFNSLLTRFAIERLLYRIGVSSLCDQFYLKGAHLFAAWTGQLHRPTRDVDFLGFGSPLPEDVANRFRQILAETQDRDGTKDGLTFDTDTMEAAEIREEQEYGGVRVKLRCHLAGARILLTIDVGFGDAVTPAPIQLEFPTLLGDPALPSPMLSVYPVPSVIAEKTQALTSLGIGNSRLKDFYDLWVISKTFEPVAEECVRAIRQTFARRRTAIEIEPLALTGEFWKDIDVRTRWAAFAKKNLDGEGRDFSDEEMLTDLRQFLLPILGWAAESTSIRANWFRDKRTWKTEKQKAKAKAKPRRKPKSRPVTGPPSSVSEPKLVQAEFESPFAIEPRGSLNYWITSQGKRHNSTCRYYRKSAKGRFGTQKEGTTCQICGG